MVRYFGAPLPFPGNLLPLHNLGLDRSKPIPAKKSRDGSSCHLEARTSCFDASSLLEFSCKVWHNSESLHWRKSLRHDGSRRVSSVGIPTRVPGYCFSDSTELPDLWSLSDLSQCGT
eukprot:42204-Rhodomonas_salina.1